MLKGAGFLISQIGATYLQIHQLYQLDRACVWDLKVRPKIEIGPNNPYQKLIRSSRGGDQSNRCSIH